MTPQSAGGLARAAKLSASDRASIAQNAANARWHRIPPPPKRKPDYWVNAYPDGLGGVWTDENNAVIAGYSNPVPPIYRIRVYLKQGIFA